MTQFSNAAPERGPAHIRLLALDAVRGAAVVAMVAYHTGWDLSYLRLIAFDVLTSPASRVSARLIAGSFLVLSGIGLALAHRDGLRPASFLRRFGVIAAAAALVTVGTALAFPEAYVFFGILHNIALSSLLVLPFLGAPAWVPAVAGAAILALPFTAAGTSLDWPSLAFLGLADRVPLTNDYVPVFPWSGFVLAGLAVGRAALGRLRPRPSDRPAGPLASALAWLGRHSLVIYLLHQPLIFGALFGLVHLVGPNPAAEAAPFLSQCEASCREAGPSVATCGAACACTVEATKREGLWGPIVANRVTPSEGDRISALAQACFAAPR